ncbi:MAG: GTP 3',8-cyclase MoaA [Leadbetterella sp.]
MLIDNHGRVVDYVRLAVTDRCNLRCFYCMPHEGINFLPKKNVISYEESLFLIESLAEMGIKKVRITGGEPFVRKDIMGLMKEIKKIPGIEHLHLTTNGVLTQSYLPELKAIGISGINLSLDSLDRKRFFEMTRRDELPAVLETLQTAIDLKIPLKINAVVLDGRNHEDIVSLAELAKNNPVDVRFIEEMPFNGEGEKKQFFLSHIQIRQILERAFGEIVALPFKATSTSSEFLVNGFQGKLGIIAAYSRTFCGTCNRLRITPTGELKTCLYDEGVVNLLEIIRSGASKTELQKHIHNAVSHRAKDGFEAEKNRKTLVSESMTTIGG